MNSSAATVLQASRNAGCILVVTFSLALAATVCVANEPGGPRLRLHVEDSIEFVVDHEISAEKVKQLAAQVRSVELRMHEELKTPRIEQTVRVYLFASHAAFSEYVRLHIPTVGKLDTAGRHGIFLLRQKKPYVFLSAGPDLLGSLRHETVHVVLNSHHENLPIWIDEGLAQCYETEAAGHWSERAATTLKKDPLFRGVPNARSLEKLKTMSQMGPREYAGSWANLQHLLSTESGRETLQSYLSALRQKESPRPLCDAIPALGRLSAK